MRRSLLTVPFLLMIAPLSIGCTDERPPPTLAPDAAPTPQLETHPDPLAGLEARLGLDAAVSPDVGRPEGDRPDPRGVDSEKVKAVRDPSTEVEDRAPTDGVGPGGYGPGNGPVVADPLAGYRGRVHVVDPAGGGDFLNIAAALSTAGSGDRIEVRPGVYREALELERPVAIIGKGPRDQVVIEVEDANVIVATAVRALVMGVTLRQGGGEPKRYGVDVRDGRLELRGCVLSSAGLAAVAVHARGAVQVVDSVLRDSQASAVFAYDGGRAEVMACEISGNRAAGIEVKATGQATISKSHLHDGLASGVFVHAGARATIEGNLITGNALAGIEVKSGARATVRGNRIVDGGQSGIFVNQGASGVFEDNIVRGNGLAGLEIKSGADPIVRRNTFDGGRQSGIFINEGALGTLEDNIIRGHALAGVEIKGGTPTLRGNTIEDNQQSGLYIHAEGGGTIERNTLRQNGKAGLEINDGARPTVTENRFEKNGYQGIWILPNGGGTFRGNTFAENARGPVRLDGESAAQVTGDLPKPAPVEPPPPAPPEVSPYDPKVEAPQ